MQVKAYRATTTQKHSGKVFLAGQIIPAEYMPPYSAQRLLSIGVITEAITDTSTGNSGAFEFPVLTDDGFVTESVTAENLFTALTIVQKVADEAIKAIESCGDQSVLMMVDSLDNRKSVKTAIDKRSAELNKQGDE